MSAVRTEAGPSTGRRTTLFARLADFWVARALLGAALVSGLLGAAVTGIQLTAGPTTKTVLVIFLINLLVVVGLQTFTGNSGVVSFGHVAFMGIGAYTTALMSTTPALKQSQIPNAPGFIRHADLAFVPSALVAIAVTCAVALPVGVVFARLTGAAAAIATLAWLVIVRTVMANWDTLTHGTFTFYGIPEFTTVWWALGFAIVAIVAARLFRESGLGLGLRATGTDPLVARAIGVNLPIARLAAWVLSAGIAAAGGVLYAHFILSLAPTSFDFDLTFVILVMVIVGGRSVSGAVLGAAAIAVLNEFLRQGEIAVGKQGLSTVVLAVIFLLMMILRPEGLLGRWELDELLVRGLRLLRARPAARVSAAQGESAAKETVGEGRSTERR